MKKLLLFIALTIFGLGLNAQYVGDETTIDYDDYSLKFKVTSVEPAECEVSDCTGTPVDVTIPSTVEIEGTEFNVTSIGESAFYYCSSLTSITFGENSQLISIGDWVFSGCSSLTSIEIPNSVTSIGEEAFSYCSSLTSIEIPNSVTSIGDGAFSGCSSITSIIVVEGNTVYDSRENCNAIIETTSNTLIVGCQNTVIPNSVTSIGESAFCYCSSLTSIEIPNSVTFIGDNAFYDCDNLTSIEIPNSVTSIGDDAFCYCSSLTSIEIPNSVTSIGDGAFSGCSSLTSIVVAEGNTVYDSRENCNAIIETTSNTLIAGCQNTVIPNSVTSIGSSAFEDCSSLTSITFGENSQLTSIGDDAFWDCSSLTSIEIPNSVTSIGNSAFWGCSSLTSIEIPNSVTSIGNTAFWGCSSLKVIKCYAEDVPQTGDAVFYICPSDMTIYVPEVSLEDYKSASPWNAFTILSLNDDGNDPLDAPENLVAEALSTSSIILTWDNVENALSYNVYQANELIANIEETIFTVDGLEYNTEYCYTVTAVRNETESDKSEEKCVKTLGEKLEELSSSINIYPNPVENDLFIATEVRVNEVSIYDIYGRLCCRDASNASTSNSMDTFNVSVQDLEAGVYFVNIKTENGNIVKRFVKN